ncbi:hypothetical protein B0H13DRAFT_1537995, partial [Mycena leptocephala]
ELPIAVIAAKNAVFELPAQATEMMPPGKLPVIKFADLYGKHEPVTDSSNISALSKISVQVFENLHGTHFRSIPTATAVVQTKQLAHIPPSNFLCLLSAPPKPAPTGLELTPEDSERFKTLSRGLVKFEEAMKLFRKRGK